MAIFGYLAAVKEQNGAAMSIGRISTFLDCYAQRDLEDGRYTEEEIQEFVDHFVMKLRIVRFCAHRLTTSCSPATRRG